jgi:hypothetical protein
MLVVLKLEF